MHNTNQTSPAVAVDSVATIASSASTSDAVDLFGNTLCGIYLPSSFDGTALSFTSATTLNGTYQSLYKNGAPLSETVAAGAYIRIDPSDFAGVQYLKITSNATESSERSLILAVRAL